MKKAQGFILVFDLTNKGSISELEEFYGQIERVKDAYSNSKDNFGRVLLGNKCDSLEKVLTKEDGNNI
jgi:GTPase SAR1 family protein